MLTLPISTLCIVAAAVNRYRESFGNPIWQAISSRLIFAAAQAYVGQACHFTHPRWTFFTPKGDLQKKKKKEKMALCPYFPVHPNWKEHVGSALYLLLSVCLQAEMGGFLYLQQTRSLQRYLEKLEKCRKYKYSLVQAQDSGICYFINANDGELRHWE